MKRRARRRIRPEQIIGQAATPVFLISVDRRIAFINSGCEKLTGWPADEVAGQLCDYVTDPRSGSLEALAASLCPPAEVFAGQIASVPTFIACRTGEPQPRMLNFIPLVDEDGTVTGILGVAAALDPPANLAETGPAQELHAELAALRMSLSRRFGTQSLICHSEGMLRVAGQLAIARGARAPVLIWGERGTGKEHVARAIHYESEWKTRAFVPLDCQGLSPLDLEQALGRLFGPSCDEEYFASPAGLWPGTIFLMHVEHLPRDLQKTVVENFRSESAARADLRLTAATSVEPSVLEADERLRPDFFHLLTHLCIAVPPLRRRMSDLRYLAQHLLEESNRGQSRQFNGFGDDVWEKFAEYNWPGNVDELLAVIHEARGTCNEPLIRAKDLPFRFRSGLDAQAVGPVIRPQVAPLEPFLAQAEKEQIERALKQCRHNKSKAAKLLGMTRPRLYRRMEILGIRDEPASA
jgi:DNA-binding NtrC family response regulator